MTVKIFVMPMSSEVSKYDMRTCLLFACLSTNRESPLRGRTSTDIAWSQKIEISLKKKVKKLTSLPFSLLSPPAPLLPTLPPPRLNLNRR